MTTEVELKFLVSNTNVSAKIFELLKTQSLAFTHQHKKLTNCYFDTPELALRQLDMGLRTRIDEGEIEQTIKTAGVVVGGLHQRPEYNVNITQAFPDLTLFPHDIWPVDENISQLQAQLIPLFNTDFSREIWQINYQNSRIELAFDQGTVSSDGRNLDICELELELLSGERDDLFALAKLLFTQLALRAGTKSKAARGYQLFANKDKPVTPISLDIECAAQQTSRYFISGVDFCLQALQQVVANYIATKKLVKLAELVDILSLLRHGFWLFNESLTLECQKLRSEISHFIQLFAWVDNALYLRELMNKTGNYRKKLEYSEQLIEQLKIEKQHFPDSLMVMQLLQSERFNKLQLELLQLIVNGSENENLIKQQANSELLPFAQVKLSDSLRELQQQMTQLTQLDAQSYLAKRQVLHRCLLTGHWFGQLFDEQLRADFRTPWLDMKQGLKELQSLWIIKQQLEKLAKNSEQTNNKVLRWQQGKVENLLTALAHSKELALSLPAYWLS
ncbi:inorganic triphosphatase [Thalassotalea insulae]|uniref:Inorganic triphosphatase n=1 Tax=Thalassotalea insulae TaxID=2056778 RepID=A0ABQ6GUI3_9GAMM|nr:CYTH and CHAD domain-containing protein [Thalassotalea insulae]GLX79557.1 inorganic triphosphatase [Thalassotalea insulae]